MNIKERRKLYYNKKWHEYSASIIKRDNFRCRQCGRDKSEVILQTHHIKYEYGLEPWEYPESDCLTLCKGCHAEEHGIIEPTNRWTLIAIDDLDGLDGICKRQGCGTEIRYLHEIYHPKCGYLTVGSSCVELLSREDQSISKSVLRINTKINDFISKSIWVVDYTEKGNKYFKSTFSHHQIRIYGNLNKYAFQILLKDKGVKWYDFQKIVKVYNKNIDQVKKLGFITLQGLLTENHDEKQLLRNIYKSIIN